MALIACPNCGKMISDKATACPGCGYCPAQETQAADVPPSETLCSQSAPNQAEPQNPGGPAKGSETQGARTKSKQKGKRKHRIAVAVVVVLFVVLLAMCGTNSSSSALYESPSEFSAQMRSAVDGISTERSDKLSSEKGYDCYTVYYENSNVGLVMFFGETVTIGVDITADHAIWADVAFLMACDPTLDQSDTNALLAELSDSYETSGYQKGEAKSSAAQYEYYFSDEYVYITAAAR